MRICTFNAQKHIHDSMFFHEVGKKSINSQSLSRTYVCVRARRARGRFLRIATDVPSSPTRWFFTVVRQRIYMYYLIRVFSSCPCRPAVRIYIYIYIYTYGTKRISTFSRPRVRPIRQLPSRRYKFPGGLADVPNISYARRIQGVFDERQSIRSGLISLRFLRCTCPFRRANDHFRTLVFFRFDWRLTVRKKQKNMSNLSCLKFQNNELFIVHDVVAPCLWDSARI